MNNTIDYGSLTLCTTAPTPNSSYLYNTHAVTVADPFSGSTMGIMMILSALQYQAPYMGPTYSNAAGQAGKAAFIDVGGQAFQDKANGKITNMATKTFLDTAHSWGITDTELAIVGGTAKLARDKGFSIEGPKIYTIKTNLTGNTQGGNLGIKYEW